MSEKKCLSLKAKLSICFIIISASMMVLLLAINFSITYKSYRESYLQDNMNNLRLSAENLTYKLDSILELSLYPYRSKETMSIMEENNPSLNDKMSLKAILLSLLNSNEEILQLHLFWDRLNIGFVGRNRSIYQKDEVRPDSIEFNVSKVYVSIMEEEDYGIVLGSHRGKEILKIKRDIFNLPREDYLGFIEFDVDLSFITSSLIGLHSGKNDEIIFLGGGLKQPYTYSENDTSYINLLEDLDLYGNDGVIRKKGFTILYGLVKPGLGMDDGYIVKIIPDKNIIKLASATASVSLLVGIVMLIISLIAIVYVAQKFTEPFSYIESELARVAKGDLNVHLDIQNTKEFFIFAEQFNDMMENLNNVVIRSYQLDLENKNNQLKALQAQLNPHFINNTLQTIGAEALKSDNLKLYMGVIQFGEMMRYTMNLKDMSVSFRDELNYTENYMKLQKMRFDQRFSYSIGVDNETYSVIIPKLALQPLVENVFKHGFSDGIERIHVRISAYIKDERFFLECSNNGSTLSEEKLDLLRRDIENARSLREEDEKIGLKNLAKRLQLLYGSDAELSVASGKEAGFSVFVSFPLEKER